MNSSERNNYEDVINRVQIEQAYEQVGGFGKFQKLSAAINVLANASAAFFLYAFAFLEKEPVYMCQLDPPSTTFTVGTQDNDLKDYYCGTEYYCQIDWDSPDSLHNLLVQLDFECASGISIGLIGFTFLLGVVVGCAFVTKLGDKYGRKPVYMAGMLMHIVLVTVLLFSHSAIFDYFILFLLGVSLTARYYVGYTFSVELQPKTHQVLVSTLMFMSESVVYLFMCLYFATISSYWIPIQIPGLVFASISLYAIWKYLPETPRYLVSAKRFDDARHSLSTIAYWNKVDIRVPNNFTFEEEETMLNSPASNQPAQNKNVAPSWKEMLPDRQLKMNLYGSIFLWMCSAFNFYLLTFYLKYFPGNIFQNSMFFAFSDMIAFAMAGLVLKYTTVVRGLRFSFIISTTGGLLYLMLSTVDGLIPVLICLSRIGNTMAYNIGYVSVNKLFPTKFIATVYGIVNMAAHIVACFSPLVAEIPNPYPFIFFLSAIGISLFASSFLSELDQESSVSQYDKLKSDENEDNQDNDDELSYQVE